MNVLTGASAGLQEAKLLEAKNFGNMYYVEYTVLKPQQPMRRLLSLVALGHNGRQALRLVAAYV